MKNIHHFGYDKSDPCPGCGEPRIWAWYDKEEKNGRSERRHGFAPNAICPKCVEVKHGHAPKTLNEINEERKKASQQWNQDQ